METTYNDEKVYIKVISGDEKYALVSKSKKAKTGLFKVDIINLNNLKLKDLHKYKKFK
jgi:predicted ATP-grasp superfamily ATP-dependent carboligase